MNRGALATVSLALLLCLPTACGSEDGAGGAAAVDASMDDEAAIQNLFADYNSALDSGAFADVCAAEGQVGPSTWRFARVDGSWKVAYPN